MTAHAAEAAAAPTPRVTDPQQTKRDSIAVATEEFANEGRAGASGRPRAD